MRNPKFVTDIMEDRLQRLQSLPRTIDNIEEATYKALGGCYLLRPADSPSAADLVQGCFLALCLWRKQVDQLRELKGRY